jgi:hypothetical protein
MRPEGYWLRADPVHLRATLRDVFLEPPGTLGLAQQEADALARDIGRHFQDRGWNLMAVRPERWYLQAPPAQLLTHPTHEVAGRNVYAFLAAGDDAKNWRSTWNELQMFLHRHPVNERRDNEGRLTVNSLWFWGGGTLPGEVKSAWRQVWSDDPIATGLAALAGAPASALPADPAALGALLRQGDECLVVLDGDERTPEEPHPLIRWLPFFQSGFPMQVTLLAPGEPARTFSASATFWAKALDRLRSFMKA